MLRRARSNSEAKDIQAMSLEMIAFANGALLRSSVFFSEINTHSKPCCRKAKSVITMADQPLKTLVTGAAGRCGRLAFERLCNRPSNFDARGLVRSKERAKDVLDESLLDRLVEGDVLDRESLVRAMANVDAVIILTSSVPRMQPSPDGGPPSFTFDESGRPELIDWEGGRNQIDVAKECGVRHIVFVGSMGSTDANHPLNKIGNGNILRYKRKAELYLIDSGVPYTIINPGGLLDEQAGQAEIEVSRNDELFKIYQKTAIPRGDVAELAVQALLSPQAKNKAFDVVCKPAGDGTPTEDFDALFARTAAGL